MSILLYMDVHIPIAITDALRRAGVDVTAWDDNSTRLSDSALLDRATELNRVLFSMDADLRREAVRRQRARIPFAGVIAADQSGITIARCIADLELIAKVYDP